MIPIRSLEDSRVSIFTSLRESARQGDEKKLFVADGEKLARLLLQDNLPLERMLISERYLDLAQDFLSKDRLTAENCFFAKHEVMEGIVGCRLHQGIMIAAKQPHMQPLEYLESPIVVLDGLANADNVGALMRCGAALGAKSFLHSKDSSPPFVRRSIRTSMGAAWRLQHGLSQDLAADLKLLKRKGISVIGTSLDHRAIPLSDFDFPEKFALVLGSEGYGLKKEIADVCDHLLIIPMAADMDSLNVACAASVFLSHARAG